MNIPKFVHTALTEHKLVGREAIEEAHTLRQMSRVAGLAELLAIVSHNASHTGSAERFFQGPFEIGEIDQTSLINRKIIRFDSAKNIVRHFGDNNYPRSELTTRGIVAINLFALDESRLSEGSLTPVLHEPFCDFMILGDSVDVSPKVS